MAPEIPEDMKDILDDFLVETNEALGGLDQNFLDLETNPGDTGLLNEIFRTVHSIKGGAGFLGLEDLVKVAHSSENLLNMLRNGEMSVTAEVIDVVLESVDTIKALLGELQGVDRGELTIGGIVQKLDLMIQFAEEAGPAKSAPAEAPATASTDSADTDNADTASADEDAFFAAAAADAASAETASAADTTNAPEPAPAPAPPAPKAESSTMPPPPKMEVETSIRVDTQRLDSVMNLVGELVLCRNRTLKLISELDGSGDNDHIMRELSATAGQLNLVTTDLQLSVMKTRMQPIGKIFQKFPRMVRDLSRKMGKDINLDIQGEDTELDKSLLEQLGDPLVHLVRNGIDHGIETSEDRVNTGKSETGTLSLKASYDGAAILITVKDDGAGIDPQKIKAAVQKKGLMTEEQLDGMSDKDAYHLIFLPGLSTKDQVSDLSGRGVGMDVVLNNIRKIGGIIDVDSKMGEGTTITLSLPLTIAIIQTMMAEASGRLFAIPLSSIIETLRLEEADVQTVDARSVIRVRDHIIPVIPLSHIFDLPPQDAKPDSDGRLHVVVVALAEKRVGLIVDSLQQQEEVVIKSLGDYLGDVPGISGATINGEGNVVLILDIGAMMSQLDNAKAINDLRQGGAVGAALTHSEERMA